MMRSPAARGHPDPNTVVDLIADLPTATTSGTHFFTIRFSSVNGIWSAPLTTQFDYFTSIDELPGISICCSSPTRPTVNSHCSSPARAANNFA